MNERQCPVCGRPAGSDTRANPVAVVTRDQVIEWMRESRGSAADFFGAAANYFGVEEEEVTED